MKFLTVVVSVLVVSSHLMAQTISLPRLERWNARATAFNDGSYVVEVAGKKAEGKWEKQLISYSAEGEKIGEKYVTSEALWAFSNSHERVNGDNVSRTIVDPENKVAYTLYTSKSAVKVYTVDINFNATEATADASVLKSSTTEMDYGSVEKLDRYYIAYVDQNGNPAWLFSLRDRVVLYQYDASTKKIKIISHKIEGELSDGDLSMIVGRENNKTWMIQFLDRGKKKATYKVKLLSIDETGKLSDEGTTSLKKNSNIMVSNFNRVMNHDNKDIMLVGVSHHEGKIDGPESGIINSVDLLKIENGKITQTNWEMYPKGITFSAGVPSFMHHRTSEGMDIFAVCALQTSIRAEVNFDESSVQNIESLKLNRIGWANKETWNVLLYKDEMTEDQVSKLLSAIPDDTNIQYAFRISDTKYITVLGKHFFADKKVKEKTTVTIE